jgi:hypothetical protein
MFRLLNGVYSSYEMRVQKIGESPPISCGDILILVTRVGIYYSGAKFDFFFFTFFFAQWSLF